MISRRYIRNIMIASCGLSLMAAVPALAEGFFLPWNKNEKTAVQKPAELVKPPAEKNMSGAVFLGKKDPAGAASAAMAQNMIPVEINNIVVELAPAMLGTQGEGPQTREEFMAVAAVQNVPMQQAAAAQERAVRERLIKSKMEYQKRLKAAELGRERDQDKPQVVPAALIPQRQAQTPAAKPQAADETSSGQSPKPSLFVGKTKQDAAPADQKHPGVFKDF